MDTKVITLAFQKGGIAKTTSAATLAAGLKKMGYSVLAVDSDTQSSLSNVSGAVTSDENKQVYTLTDVLSKRCAPEEAIQHLDVFDILPSKSDLIAFQANMGSIVNKDFLFMRSIVKPLADQYDYIIFDTNASFCDLAKNAIVAAQEVIIPMNADEQSFGSLEQQIATIDALNEGYDGIKPATEIAGILITMFHPNEIVNKIYDEKIKKYGEANGIKVFNTHIRYATAVKQAQMKRQNLFDARSDAGVSQDYFEFIKEFLNGGEV